MRRVFLSAILLLAAGGIAVAAGPRPRIVVFFQSWSAKLDEAAEQAIRSAAEWAKQHPQASVTVIGYASTVGGAQANEDLSRLRAQIVSDTLVADGVAPARIRRRALGPVDYALDPQETRRVEIALGEE
jgi:outer membrane protein OmpA-like peptidoglycan-associated protein